MLFKKVVPIRAVHYCVLLMYNSLVTTNGNFVLGKRSKVVSHRSCIAKIAVSFGGITAGERNGERGYMLTFVIAYIRVRKIT